MLQKTANTMKRGILSSSYFLSVCYISALTAQELEQNAQDSPKKDEAPPQSADTPKSPNAVTPIVPTDPNAPAQPPVTDGMVPLVTPFDSVLENGKDSPLDFSNSNGGITPLIIPSATTDSPLVDPNSETPEDSLAPELETLPEPAQAQLPSSLADDFFLNSPDDSLLPTLMQGAALGSGNAMLSEIPGMFSGGMPIGRYSRRGLSFHAILNQTYDTNPARIVNTQAYEGDWITSASILAAYQPVIRGLWSFDGSIHYGYTKYLEIENLDSAFSNINATMAYAGARTTSRVRFHYNSSKGANREVINQVFDQTNLRLSNNTRYNVSPRSSLDLALSYDLNELQGNFNDSRDSITARLSGVWKYSQLLEFGVGLRVSEQNSDFGFTRSSYGPSLLANYRLSSLIRLRSEVAMEYATLNDNINKTGIDASVGFTYSPNTLWSLNFDYRRSNQPVLGDVARVQVLNGFRIGMNRNVGSTSTNFGVGYEGASIDGVGTTVASFERNFLFVDASISHPLYKDILNGSFYIRYADQKENARVWESTQLGFAVGYLF